MPAPAQTVVPLRAIVSSGMSAPAPAGTITTVSAVSTVSRSAMSTPLAFLRERADHRVGEPVLLDAGGTASGADFSIDARGAGRQRPTGLQRTSNAHAQIA